MATLWNPRYLKLAHSGISVPYLQLLDRSLIPQTPQAGMFKSLQKWILVARWHRKTRALVAIRGSLYSDSCGLCDLYAEASCDGCPIHGVTGHTGCSKSPFDAYRDYPGYQTARLEVNFLVQLARERGYLTHVQLERIHAEFPIEPTVSSLSHT